MRVRVEPLTPILDLSTHSLESKAREAIASCFDALVLATRHIQAHYKKMAAEAMAKFTPTTTRSFDNRCQKACSLPFITTRIVNGLKMDFTYNQRPDNSNLVFSATVNESSPSEPAECAVEFARLYSASSSCIL